MNPLENYSLIVEGKKLANYLIVKKTKAKKPSDLADAWKKHEQAIIEYRKNKTKTLEKLESLSTPAYSLLDLKFFIADKLTEACCFCERRCGVNRKKGIIGNCGVGYESRVATAFEHFGEERVIVPSGTIFFAGCPFHCAYCQNWDISQFPKAGEIWSPKKIAGWIENEWQARAIKNVNLVGGDPIPNLHNILAALNECEANLSIIWNSNMFMSVESMQLLEGAVDVFLADFRYGNNECAKKHSLAPKYFETTARNFKWGLEYAEILTRILVLPSHVECCAKPILEWIWKNLDDKTHVNLMSQYHPEYKAFNFPEIARRLTRQEYSEAVEHAKKLGFKNIEFQG